jgi:hypothetical protein
MDYMYPTFMLRLRKDVIDWLEQEAVKEGTTAKKVLRRIVMHRYKVAEAQKVIEKRRKAHEEQFKAYGRSDKKKVPGTDSEE